MVMSEWSSLPEVCRYMTIIWPLIRLIVFLLLLITSTKCIKDLMLVLSIGNNDTTMKKLYFCTNRYLIQWLLTEFDKVLGELQFWVKPFTHTVQNVTSSWKENSDSKFAKPYRIKGALDKPSAKWSTSIVHFFSVHALSSSVVFMHWLLL